MKKIKEIAEMYALSAISLSQVVEKIEDMNLPFYKENQFMAAVLDYAKCYAEEYDAYQSLLRALEGNGPFSVSYAREKLKDAQYTTTLSLTILYNTNR